MFLPLIWIVAVDTVDVDTVDVEGAILEDSAAFSSPRAVTSGASAASPSVAEALRGTPGVSVLSTGGAYDFSTLSIRGSSSTQVGVYLDGLPFSPTSVGTVDLSTLLLFDIDHIVVHRGLSPAVLGPDGFLGALELQRNKKPLPGLVAGVSVGSFGTRQLTAGLSGEAAGWLWTGAAVYAGKRGDFTYLDDHGTPLNPDDDQRLQRQNGDLNAVSARLEVRRDVGGGARLSAGVDLYAKDQGAPAPSSVTMTRARYSLVRPALHVAVEDWKPTPTLNLSASLSSRVGQGHFSDLTRSLYSSSTAQEMRELESHGLLRATVAVRDWLTLDTSLSLGHAAFSIEAPSAPSQWRQRLSAGFGVSALASLWSGRLDVEAQVRGDVLLDQGLVARSLFDPGTLDRLSLTRFWLQPTLGLRGEVLPGLALIAHVGQRARPPTFYELFGTSGQLHGNPTLTPEAQWSWDAGVRGKLGWFTGEVVYSEARLTNVIAFVQAGGDLPQAVNIASAAARLVEVDARARPLSWLSLAASYTLQLTKSDTPGPEQGHPLPGRPTHQGRAELSVRLPFRTSVMYEFIYISQLYLDVVGSRPAPARMPNNVSLRVQPFRETAIFLSLEVRNLFDQTTALLSVPILGRSIAVQTVDYLGFPLPGRSFFFTLVYAFGERAKAMGDT